MILIDSGVAVNLMPHSMFKKLGREDDELVKTNLTLKDMGWGGGNPMEDISVVSRELIIGSKSLANTLFIIEVQGNYSVILGHDWIHINYCISSTLHQLLIQWIDDEIEIVHADTLAYIALADATAD
jgi:hypothetical protein